MVLAGRLEDHTHAVYVVGETMEASKVLTRGDGAALFDRAVGRSIAYSTKSGLVVFVRQPRGFQLHNSDAFLFAGRLDVWNARTGTQIAVGNLEVWDEGLSGFPGGSQLAIVVGIRRSAFGEYVALDVKLGKSFDAWSVVPVVHVLDLEDGTTSPVNAGWSPIASPDGEHVLVGDFDNNWLLAGLTIPGKSVAIAGFTRLGAVGFVDDRRILYLGLPTDGTAMGYTKTGSPLVGPWQLLSLKVVDSATGRFATLLTGIDPRARISLGD